MSAPAIDEQLVDFHIAGLHRYVANNTAHLTDPGMIQCAIIRPAIVNKQTEHAVNQRFQIGDDVGMRDYATYWSQRDYNFYTQGRTVDEQGNTVWVFALVIDWDGYGVVPLEPTYAIETSPGRVQYVYLTSLEPLDGEWMAARLYESSKTVVDFVDQETGEVTELLVGADPCSGQITQNFRLVPGLLNHPNQKKLDEGRGITPTTMFFNGKRTYSFDELDSVLPLVAEASPGLFEDSDKSSDAVCDALYVQAPMAHVCFNKFKPPRPVTFAGNVISTDIDRSEEFARGCFIAFKGGLLPGEVFRVLVDHYPNGPAQKYLMRRRGVDRLRDAVASRWNAWLREGNRRGPGNG